MFPLEFSIGISKQPRFEPQTSQIASDCHFIGFRNSNLVYRARSSALFRIPSLANASLKINLKKLTEYSHSDLLSIKLSKWLHEVHAYITNRYYFDPDILHFH
jgi:hypothetical protein